MTKVEFAKKVFDKKLAQVEAACKAARKNDRRGLIKNMGYVDIKTLEPKLKAIASFAETEADFAEMTGQL